MSTGNRGIVVSHDPGFVNQVGRALEASGCILSRHNSAETAQIEATEKVFALVVTEAELPGLSGFELCRQLKEDEVPPKVIVVHRGDPRATERADEAGADALLQRPITAAGLVELVDELLGPAYFLKASQERPPARPPIEPSAGAAGMSIVDPATGVFGPDGDSWADAAVSSAVMALASQQMEQIDAGNTMELPEDMVENFDEEHPVSVKVDAGTTAHFLPPPSEGDLIADSDSNSFDSLRSLVSEEVNKALAPGGAFAERLEAAVNRAVVAALHSVLPKISEEAARIAKGEDES